jgi:hypothetical protein
LRPSRHPRTATRYFLFLFLFGGPADTTTLTLEPAVSVLPGPGLVEITLPLCTFLDAFFVILPTLQFSAGITVLATDSGAPASAIVLHGVLAGRFTVNVADALLLAVLGSASDVETLAVSVNLPAEGAVTTIETLELAPEESALIVQLTACPVTVQVPDPATADRIVRPLGTVSVNVIGTVVGPAWETVNEYSAAPPAVIDEGIAEPVIDTSSLCTSVAATLVRMFGALTAGV